MAVKGPKPAEKQQGLVLAASVSVHDPDSAESTTYLLGTPKSEIPAEHAKQMGEHCFVEVDDEV